MKILLFFVALIAWCHAIPAGFSTFFAGKACPQGWSFLPTVNGRLIVSVADGNETGITVNEPLSNQEDRTHTHAFSAIVNMPDKEIAAIGCCNDQGAAAGDYLASNITSVSSSGLPFIQLVFCSLEEATTDPVPIGTVGFFAPQVNSCPKGWEPWDAANGRIVVPGYSTSGAVASQADPLASGEDRTHTHIFQTSFSTTDVSYVGVAGCCDTGVAASGTYDIYGTTAAASTGLPYIQLLTCTSATATFQSGLPSGALVFNELGCDAPGWNTTFEVSGRFPVALPNNGIPGATFGSGASLPPDFTGNPSHAHPFSGELSTNSTGVGLASGCCATGYAGAQRYEYQGTTDDGEAAFPYMLTPLCMQQQDIDDGLLIQLLIDAEELSPNPWYLNAAVNNRHRDYQMHITP